MWACSATSANSCFSLDVKPRLGLIQEETRLKQLHLGLSAALSRSVRWSPKVCYCLVVSILLQ